MVPKGMPVETKSSKENYELFRRQIAGPCEHGKCKAEEEVKDMK